jgi:hypothetical protein
MDFNLRAFPAVFLVSTFLLLASLQSFADDTPCAQGLDAFKRNVYKPILRTKCIDCHDVGGIGPAHSSSDPVASYKMIKTYVQFAQLNRSRIVQHVQSQHWADYNSKETGVSVADIMTALQSWWDQGESSCPDSATAQTATLAIPTDLPLFPSQSFVPVSWKLDSLGPAFVGSQFQVEVQQMALPTSTTSGAYRLRKPRIATPRTGMVIKGIRFFINGKDPLNAVGWENIGSRIGGHIPATLPQGSDPFALAPVLSGRHLILLQDQVQGDMLSVAFTGVQVTPTPNCKNLSGFQKSILPVLQASSCTNCHSGGTPSSFNGSGRLLLNGNDAQVCATALERADFAHPEASAFYLIGFLNEYDHPPSTPAPQGFEADWKAWIATEQK